MESSGQLRRHRSIRSERFAAGAPESYLLRNPSDYPATHVSLRSASAESFTIVDVSSGELLGTTEATRAHSAVHKGAIYLHLARRYEVRELDLERQCAMVSKFDGDWYTEPKRETETTIEELLDTRETLGVKLSFGRVKVSDTVLAYQRRLQADNSRVDLVELDLPATSFSTQAVWCEMQSEWLSEFLPMDVLLGSLHATEHVQIAVLPLIAMCDRWDIGGLSTSAHAQTGGPTIFIYDGHPGGVGIARTAFARFEDLCEDALSLISECPCSGGCPSCVQSPTCGILNDPLSKTGAGLLLGRMLAETVKINDG